MDLRNGRITTCLVSVLTFAALAAAPPAARAASPVIEWEFDQVRPAVAHNPENDTYLVAWEDHHWGFGNDWDDPQPAGNALGFANTDGQGKVREERHRSHQRRQR